MPGPELRVIGGPADGTTIPLGDEPFVIGRGEEAAGRLGDDPELSRRHARVYKQSGRVIVEDLGSMNGTFVNGRRIDEPTAVAGDDSIEVGGTKLRIDGLAEPQVTAARPAPVAEPQVTAVRPAARRPAPPAPAVGPRLRVVAGRSSGLSIPIGREPFVIGRGEEGDGGLGGDPELSREHARVSLEDGHLLIEGLGSTNGTFVNGRRIPAPTVIKPGDAIWIGTTTCVVTTPEEPVPQVALAEPPTPSGETGFLGRFADLSDRHPKRMLIAIGVFFVIAAAFGGPVAGLLGADNAFVDPSAESVKTKERIAAASGELPGPQVIALVNNVDVKAAATRTRVRKIEATIKRERLVSRTMSFYDTRNRAFVSRDGRSTYVAAFFKNSSEGDGQDAAGRIQTSLEGERGVILGGSALVGKQLGEQVGKDLGKAEAMAFPLLFALSLFVFRGVIAALLPLFVGALTVFTTFFVLRIINTFVDISEFALNVVIGLGLGLAIDYSLFIVSRYREELARVGQGQPPSAIYGALPRSEAKGRFGGTESEALRRAILTAGRTVLYSAITVAIALAALISFPQPFLRSMGIGGAVCALSAVTVSLVALPALLAVIGPRINSLAPKRWQQAAARTARQERTGPWYRLSQAVMKRPATIASVSATFLIVLGLPALGIKFTGVDVTAVPKELSARQVDDTLKARFPANPTTGQITVLAEAPRSAKARIESYARDLRRRPGASRRVALAPEALKGGLWTIPVIPSGEALDERSLDLVRSIRDGRNPFPVTVTGDSATFLDQKSAIKAHLPPALLFLSATTIIVLFLMTGSVILPIKSLIMNFLSLSAAFGLLVLIFQEGNLEGVLGFESPGALEISQPVLLFAIAFGLSTDYAVFLLTRIKEARASGESERDAVAIGLERTGRIVTQAALLFCIAIGAFATSSVIFIKEVGVGTALAVILDATIVRALLVPSLMALLGAKNWWAPGPLRRLHNKIGLSEG